MVALPVAMAALPANSAMVKVGPPLFAKGPRRGSAVKAGVKVPVTVPRVSTRLLVFVFGAKPTKSLPLVLLAMMVLAILRVPTGLVRL